MTSEPLAMDERQQRILSGLSERRPDLASMYRTALLLLAEPAKPATSTLGFPSLSLQARGHEPLSGDGDRAEPSGQAVEQRPSASAAALEIPPQGPLA